MSGPDPGRRLMIAAVVVVAATLVAAVLVMDSPSRQRAERLDERRVDDLRLLSRRIATHLDVHGELPGQLAVVMGPPGQAVADPATGRPYQYEVAGERAYRLCASFETASEDRRRGPVHVDDEWRHAEGRQCFDRQVDADGDATGKPAEG